MRKRVLIGSCGGLTGIYLSRQFNKNGCTVIGADSSEDNAALPFLDAFHRLPYADSEGFMNSLIGLLKKERIDYYIPTHSREIEKISEFENSLRAQWSGQFVVCPYETFLKLNSKKNANMAFADIGIPVPEMISDSNVKDASFPIFMKPDIGSGSKKACPVETEALYREFRKIYPDACFYRMIRGREFTVDCFYSCSGELISFNQRIRIKSIGGAVVITKNDNSFDIAPYLAKISRYFTFKGCVNFQYILSEGTPFFIDVNLRYASGGLPLSVKSGIDVPKLMLEMWDGKKHAPFRPSGAEGKTMYRYFNEWYK